MASGPRTVSNTPPSISGVTISPSAGTETTTFTCLPVGWTDVDPADSIPGYTWQWTVNGNSSVSTQTIDGETRSPRNSGPNWRT